MNHCLVKLSKPFELQIVIVVKTPLASRILIRPVVAFSWEIYLKSANTADQVLAFERGGLLFIFNFHPTKSYTNYGIPINAGKFKIVLSSDDEEFGGFKRVDKDMSYYTRPLPLNKTHHHLQLYIPSRIAMVLKRQPIKSVYG